MRLFPLFNSILRTALDADGKKIVNLGSPTQDSDAATKKYVDDKQQTIVLDDTVTETSSNGVKSSGIWSWVKSLLPHWLTSDYAEPATVESVANKRDKGDLAVYEVVRTENTDWTWTSENAELAAALNAAHSKPIWTGDEYHWDVILPGLSPDSVFYFYRGDIDSPRNALSVAIRFIDGGYETFATATRPRYMDETLGSVKTNQQLAAVATGDAQTPANGDLVKYDAANDRLVKATASDIPELPYLSTKNGGTVDGFVKFNGLVVCNSEIQPATVRAMAGDVIATVDGNTHNLSYKADRATTLAGYGITDGATKESITPEYSATSAYSVGSIVYHDGNIYQCKTAIAEGGEAWNAEHWELRKLDDFFTESNSLLNGRLAYERNEAGLKDRAFNALSFDGTEYNLSTALAAVTPTASGQPRDLLIVATATAATTISFTAGTIKGDKPTIDGSGTWLITLTEYASGVWYCRQIKMEDAA